MQVHILCEIPTHRYKEGNAILFIQTPHSIEACRLNMLN